MKLARKQCPSLFDCIDNLFFIHYSCENLSDDNEGYSPRVTSIAVLHHKTKMMRSFSIHLVAERKGVPRSEIENHYNDLELEMLNDFMSFIDANPQACYLHWHMTNINYGFEAIWHRYECLSGKRIAHIPADNKFNLPTLLKDAFGAEAFEKKHMMYKLMQVNEEQPRDVLEGEQEVKAFKNKEYVKMHRSTLAKTYWFHDVFMLAKLGKLKLNHNPSRQRIDLFFESTIFKIFGLIGIVMSIAGTVIAVW